MNKRATILISAAVIVAGGLVAWGIWTSRAPMAGLPADAAQISPSAEFADAETAADYYRAWIRREPGAVEPRIRLAQVLIQLAEASGREAQFIPEAKSQLDDALTRDPDNYYGLTLKASLLNKLHRFEDARELSERLLVDYPAHAFTHGTLIDALVELGEYDEAVRVSDRLQALRPGLPAYARASYLRGLHGDTEGAIVAMRMAADAEPAGRVARAWALMHLGELYLGQAKPDTAAYIFRGILDERADFAPAMAGLGHVELFKGNAAEAVRRLETARSMRESGTTDELLAEAYAVLGNLAKSQEAADRVLAGLQTARGFGEIVDMEEADFLADHDQALPRALELSRTQVQRRPGHLHANETYAWTLFKNRRADEAIPYIERAMRLGTGDAMVHYRAARIYEAAGRNADAAEHYRHALDGNVAAESPIAAADARRRIDGPAVALNL